MNTDNTVWCLLLLKTMRSLYDTSLNLIIMRGEGNEITG
jgi:hypothetical protein